MSHIKEYAKQILDSFNRQIIEYFESFRSDRNALYLSYLVDVQMLPPQSREFDIGIPLEQKKKIDFEIETIEYSMPTVARLIFQNFPLREVMVRVDFPNVLYGPKGLYPKIIFSAQLNRPWPGEFGLVWLALTGSEQFAFHPYQEKDKKAEELQKFYAEGIVDPLCDFLNSSNHTLASRLRENIKMFIASDNVKTWNYRNPFNKKKQYNMLDVPIYCEFFDDNEASILYFESYAIKDLWLPPADIIVDIMQYIGLSTELFDDDGNLLSEDKIEEIEKVIEKTDEIVLVHEKTKKSAELREEWDPFKPVSAVKRDSLGYSIDDGVVVKEDHQSVLDQVSRMKALMQQKHESEAEKPVPPQMAPAEEPTTTISKPPVTARPRLRGVRPETIPAPITTPPQSAIPTSPKPSSQSDWPTYPQELKSSTSTPPIQPAPTPATPATPPATITESPFQWDDTPPKTSTPPPPPTPAQTPAIPAFASAKDWFNEYQLRQCVTVGNGSDIEFRKRGDFKIIAALPKPFMLTFARDELRMKKSLTSGEVIEILFAFFKSGHITAL